MAEVASPRELAALLTAPAPAEGDTPSLLLVGDVDFGSDTTGAALRAYAPLPGTAAGVPAVAALAEGAGVATHVLTGAAATPEAVAAALPAVEYAHLATHGFFYGESREAYDARAGGPAIPVHLAGRNPLVESGLPSGPAFAPAPRAASRPSSWSGSTSRGRGWSSSARARRVGGGR